MKAVVFRDRGNQRSERIAQAMAAGIRAAGDHAELATVFDGVVRADVAIAYGWNSWSRAFSAYREAGKRFVYVDLGFFGRSPAGKRLEGYHKVSVDGWYDPGFRGAHPPDRFAQFGLQIQIWRSGHYILVAGMSAKAARTHGFQAEEWERRAIAEIKRHTDKLIVYRPKPSWKEAQPLPGAGYSPPAEAAEHILSVTHAVVTHHSNLAVDALIAGVPVYCETGVASALSMPSLACLDDPPLPGDREAFLSDVAYSQWTPAEMETGACWRHLRERLAP